MSAHDEAGGGVTAFRGFDYQILATVWLALKLVIERAVTDAIEIEPLSGEDVASDLSGGELSERAETWSTARLNTPVQVQIKLRSSPWSSGEFASLLDGGRADERRKRRPALPQLEDDPTLRYVLLTNAQLGAGLSSFAVDEIGADSRATALPSTRLDAYGEAIARRVGVLEQRTPKQLESEIRDLLHLTARVPYLELDGLTERLRAEVRKRLLATTSAERTWTRTDIQGLIRAHDGLPEPYGPFVEPTGWARIRERLERDHSLLLIGMPGVGKSRIADELVHLHRLFHPPFAIVTASDGGLEGVRRALSEPGRTLVHLDDVWGGDRLSGDAPRWLDALPDLLDRATDDKRFLLTSRKNILGEVLHETRRSSIAKVLERAKCMIDEKSFNITSRMRMLELFLGPDLERLDVEERGRLANELRRPISLKFAASEVTNAPPNERIAIQRVIDDARPERLTDVVAAQVAGLDEASRQCVAILSVLSAARVRLPGLNLETLRMQIRQIDRGFSGSLKSVAHRLEQSGWASLKADLLAVHPLIRAGFVKGLEDTPALAEDALHGLIGAYRAQPELARQLLFAAFDLKLPLRRDDIARIESELARDLVDTARGALRGEASARSFNTVWDDLDRVTKIHPSLEQNTLAAVVRSLEPVRRQGGWLEFDSRPAPAWAPATWDAVRSTDGLDAVLRVYVRTRLPMEHGIDGGLLVEFCQRLGLELSNDALDALEVDCDVPGSSALVECALSGSEPAYEQLLAIGRKALRAIEQDEEEKESLRQASEDMLNPAYADHLCERAGEREDRANEIIERVVLHALMRVGPAWFQRDDREDLFAALIRAFDRGKPGVFRQKVELDLDALRGACPRKLEAELLGAVASWNFERAPAILARAADLPLLDRAHVLGSAWRTHGRLHMRPKLGDMLTACAREQTATLTQRDRLAFACRVLAASQKDDDNYTRALVLRALPVTERKAVALLYGREDAKLKPELVAPLEAIASTGPSVASARALSRLVRHGIVGSPPLIEASLLHEDWRVRAAVLGALPRERLIGLLDDARYHVRKDAFQRIGAPRSEAEESRLLRVADDPSAAVRVAFAQAAGARRWGGAVEKLRALLGDEHDSSGGYANEPPTYEVARAAAQALVNLSRSFPAAAEAALRFCEGGKTEDAAVLRILSRVNAS